MNSHICQEQNIQGCKTPWKLKVQKETFLDILEQ